MLRPSGFTLLELLLATSIGAVLLVLAVPAFTTLLLDARLTAEVNQFVHGMHVARHAAWNRGVDIALCRSNNGRQCTHTLGWQDGFIVFINRDRDDPPRVDATESVLQVGARFSGAIQANRRAFVFRPYGKRSVNGTLTFCDRRGMQNARAVIVSYTGRPRAVPAAEANGAITCPG